MTTIKLKNGSGAPTSGDLVQGEPALDLTNKRLYTENASGTVIEVGTNPTSITTGDITATGTATFANLATSGDVTFGDNDKAIFGASSDLQIYHDGTHSVIEDAGTGNLILQSNGAQVSLQSTTELYLTAANNGAVTAYHNGSAKLTTTSTGIDVTGTITFDGGTTSADINFGDNDKAIFGAGSDLQIYHDGSHSYIVDAGTGNMYLSTNGNGIVMQASLSETMFSALPNGSVRLYHDNSQKLETTSTGIDVTGSVTADDIVISNGSPTLTFYETDTTNLNARFDNGGGDLYIQTVHDDGTNAKTRILVDHSDGDISFFNNAGSSQDLYWDASTSRLGLGTTSPSFKLTLEDSVPYFRTKNTSAPTDEKTWDYNAGTDGIFRFRATNDAGNTSNNWLTVNRTGATIDYIAMHTASGTERMRIDSSGNVGIGTTSPSSYDSRVNNLVVGDSGDAGITIFSGASNYARLQFAPSGDTGLNNGLIGYDNANDKMSFATAGSDRMEIESDGNLRVYDSIDNLTGTLTLNGRNTGQIRFESGGSLKMLMDSSGHLGIGASSVDQAIHVEKSSGTTIVKTEVASGSTVGFEIAKTGDTTQSWRIVDGATANGVLEFYDLTNTTTRMALDGSGNFLVGTTNSSTTAGAGLKLTKPTTSGNDDGKLAITGETSTSAQDAFQIYSTGASAYRCFINYAGSIYATSTSITAISDESLKENIRDLDKGLNTVLALQPRRFDWKNGDGNDIMGFVAQEVEEVMPELVHDYKYSETETKLGLKMGDMLPTLVKAIQDQQEIIENLKSRIEQLEGAN